MKIVASKDERRSPRAATAVRHQELRDRLIAAAEAAIAGDGLENMRARSLAEAAGCSVGAIYGVFPDLDALVLAVNGRTLDAIDAAMRGAAATSGPEEHLVRLAECYLDYAATHRRRWSALFQHRMPQGRPVSRWYAQRQASAFANIEQPLARLLPALSQGERTPLARTLFSAVHGMVALGLEEKVAALPLKVLRAQVRVVVVAIARGLTPLPSPAPGMEQV